ncbi:MAG: hypothetical protein RLZZ196_263 [Bacteroidota bacterium]|jgi:hypothetical protein
MNHYWTCSKFADWLRGTTKLKAGTSEEWHEWEARAKSAYPIRWWLAEEGLDYLQRFVFYIPDKIHAIKYYINNRWVTHTHALTAHPRDIKPGNWCDVGNRFLPCLFNELVDFVEVELAWWHIAWDEEARKKFQAPWYASGWFRWRTWRCPQAGLDNLKWQSELVWKEDETSDPNKVGKPTYQAEKALEILALYKWWTETYRNRPEPMEASGWSAYCDACRNETGSKLWLSLAETKNKELKKQGDKAHKLLQKIEEAYEKEDEQMMIRLIKVRNSLWT